MPKYIVTVFHDIGEVIVEAENASAAMKKVKLTDFFDHGYSASLKKRAVVMPRQIY